MYSTSHSASYFWPNPLPPSLQTSFMDGPPAEGVQGQETDGKRRARPLIYPSPGRCNDALTASHLKEKEWRLVHNINATKSQNIHQTIASLSVRLVEVHFPLGQVDFRFLN